MKPTIVLIHGLWVTPRSWEHWVARFTGQGYEVLTPAYPGLEVEVEALRADPSPIAAVTIPATIAHLEDVISKLKTPPILMGHSFGGALVQILLDHGYGAAGVTIDSVATEGVLTLPLSQIKATFPVLDNPANRHKAVPFTASQFHYAFANSLNEDESLAVYERYAVAAPGSWIWGGALANFKPGRQEGWVDYANNDRAPLLFIAGGDDHLVPPVVNKSNFKHYHKSTAVTEYKEFEGRTHYTVGQPGWEEVADFALTWAAQHLAAAPATPATAGVA